MVVVICSANIATSMFAIEGARGVVELDFNRIYAEVSPEPRKGACMIIYCSTRSRMLVNIRIT